MKHLKLFLFALILQSCATTYHQVYTVDTNMEINEQSIIHSDENCDIIYNLWGEGGRLDFIYVNKTNEEICLDMEHSFVIYNGIAKDYYEDTEYSTTTAVNTISSNSLMESYNANITKYGYTQSPYLNTPTSIGKGVALTGATSTATSVSKSSTITQKPAKYIYIPAQAAKVIPGFEISERIYKKGDDKFDAPRKKSAVIEYDYNNTPLHVRNSITYTKGEEVYLVENEFWINSIQNYNEYTIIRTDLDVIYYQIERLPNMFYNKYKVSQW